MKSLRNILYVLAVTVLISACGKKEEVENIVASQAASLQQSTQNNTAVASYLFTNRLLIEQSIVSEVNRRRQRWQTINQPLQALVVLNAIVIGARAHSDNIVLGQFFDQQTIQYGLSSCVS